MRLHTSIRYSMLLCLVAPLAAQQRRPSPLPPPQSAPLPATAPTVIAPPPPPLTPAQSPSAPAKITYQQDQLTVSASNSSLNQILHEVSRIAGITITGGVGDERVFGDYGPAPIAQVLNELLDGTGSNMLFIGSTEGHPAQLILTPRSGGPTPPNPNAMRSDQDADASSQPVYPPAPPDPDQTQPTATFAAPPPPPPPAPNAGNAATPATGTPAAATPDGADQNQQSPNGVKTPQQIYNELMKMRQQQQPSR